MTVTPFDLDTFHVSSRTQDEIEHLVDLSDEKHPVCSCPGFFDFKVTDENRPCAHIEAAIAFRNGQKITRRPGGGSPLAIFGKK